MTGTRPTAVSDDLRRTARLLFHAELAAGTVTEEGLLAEPAVRRVARRGAVPPLPVRVGQVLHRKLRPDDGPERATAAAVAARRAVLGAAADGPPRVLVRMDEYPHWLAGREPDRFGDAAFGPWPELLAGCPHLVAVVPRIADDPEAPSGPARDLSDTEVARLERLAADGVAFGLHGLEHRTRFTDPRLHTELGHRAPAAVLGLVDEALAALGRRTGLRPRVLVPPFNTFGARQYPALARRFDVITGGPESVLRVGMRTGPVWWGDAVYLPAYPPLYGTAAQIRPALERHLEAATGLWTPVVLHWGWERAAGWRELERLVELVAPVATPWSHFLDTVEATR